MTIQTRGPAKDLVSMTSIIPRTIIFSSIFAVSNNLVAIGFIIGYCMLQFNLISGQNEFNLG